jgi:hypothetical protein
MQPHTMHMVLTLEPTLAYGGYFYSGFHMNRTMHGRRLNVYHGPIFTNDSQAGASSLLHRMVLYIHQLVFEGHEGQVHRKPGPLPNNSPFSFYDIAVLVLMCGTVPNTGHVTKDRVNHLQHCKAQEAASYLAKWDKVQEHLKLLQDRKAEWQTYCKENPLEVDD